MRLKTREMIVKATKKLQDRGHNTNDVLRAIQETSGKYHGYHVLAEKDGLVVYFNNASKTLGLLGDAIINQKIDAGFMDDINFFWEAVSEANEGQRYVRGI